MNTCRPAVQAGRFYSAAPEQLRIEVRQFLNDVERRGTDQPIALRALIAPHAGLIYSGPVAAAAYSLVAPRQFDRVAVIGPSHRVAFDGAALSSDSFFETPLGRIRVDNAGLSDVAIELDEAHREEHSIEVQLPFLQCVLENFRLTPIVVGRATPDHVAKIVERLWSDRTLIVASSDLSHFLPYDAAQIADAKTDIAIRAKQYADLDGNAACGFRPIQGLLRFAAAHQLNVTRLDLRNSGDTAGRKDRVVGYGAYALH